MSMQVDGAYIEITSKCNMKCKQCYNDSEQRNNKFVTREEYVRTMKALVEHGCKIIVISGGEPLLSDAPVFGALSPIGALAPVEA